MRPVNMAICAFSVACGGLIGGQPLERLAGVLAFEADGGFPAWAIRVAYAAVSASLILAAGNAFNDVRDIETDRINAPRRPIPSGMVSTAAAVVLSVMLCAAGLILSLPLGGAGIAVAITAAVLLFLYDVRLKGVPLAGNVSVAFLGGLAFVYGGVAGDCIRESLVPAVFAILLHLGRELVKDAEDVEGDREAGLSTAATAWGVRTALRLAAAVLIVLLIATAIPFFNGYFGLPYALVLLFGVWPAVRMGAVLAFRPPARDRISRASLFLKIAMPAGILAVLAGFQGRSPL